MKNAVIDFIPGVAVDELAELLATIAPLQKRADAIKDQLKATGMERIIGSFHEAVISLSESHRADLDKIKTKLKCGSGSDKDEAVWRGEWCKVTLATTCKVTARKVH